MIKLTQESGSSIYVAVNLITVLYAIDGGSNVGVLTDYYNVLESVEEIMALINGERL